MLANIRLLAASRTEALSLQLSGSEALGVELTLKGQVGALRGMVGYVDDAAMTFTRWWDMTYAAAGRQDSLDVLLGVGGGGKGGGGGRGVGGVGKKGKMVEEEGKGEEEGGGWWPQPRRRVRLMVAGTQLGVMLVQSGGLLLGLVKRYVVGGKAGTGRVWVLGNAGWDVGQLVQLVLPGMIAAGLFGYVVKRARWYVSWPQVAPELLGVQPPWKGGPEVSGASYASAGCGVGGGFDGGREKKEQ